MGGDVGIGVTGKAGLIRPVQSSKPHRSIQIEGMHIHTKPDTGNPSANQGAVVTYRHRQPTIPEARRLAINASARTRSIGRVTLNASS